MATISLRPLKKSIGMLLLLSTAVTLGCRSAPITGRKQLVVLPETQEVTLGATAYQEVLSKQPASTNQQSIELVNRVGQRIAAVAGRPDYQWEFKVIASPEQNAFCLPGGKVAVHEGILPVCQNEAGLAVVMSHEIGHALARHGGERISQGYAVEAVRKGVALVSNRYAEQQSDMILRGYGVASQYGVILPYSRKHESEADHIGMMLLAQAGYDPEEAPRFWARFATAHEGNQPSEFLSTHPSDERRSQDLAALLPAAMQLYASAPNKYGLGQTLDVSTIATAQPKAPEGDASSNLRTASNTGGTLPLIPISPTTPATATAAPAASSTTKSADDHLQWLPPPIRSAK
jgi:predicted Zn-dependent protease